MYFGLAFESRGNSTVAIYINVQTKLFLLGMTNFFQSVSQVDNNIIKSQEEMIKKGIFLFLGKD